MWLYVALGLIVFAAFYEGGARVFRKAFADHPEKKKAIEKLNTNARIFTAPLIVGIAFFYFVATKNDPANQATYYRPALVVCLATLLGSAIVRWRRAIKLVGPDKTLREKLTQSYALELAGILAAAAVARFL